MDTIELNILESDIIYNVASFCTEKEICNFTLINKRIKDKINTCNNNICQIYKNRMVHMFNKILESLFPHKNSNYYKELYDLYENDKNELVKLTNPETLKLFLANHFKKLNYFLNDIKKEFNKINPIVYELCDHIIENIKKTNKLTKMYIRELKQIKKNFYKNKFLKRNFMLYSLCLISIHQVLLLPISISLTIFLNNVIIFLGISFFAMIYSILHCIKIICYFKFVNYKNIYEFPLYDKNFIVIKVIILIDILLSLPHLFIIHPLIKCTSFDISSKYFIVPELYYFHYKDNRFKYLKFFYKDIKI